MANRSRRAPEDFVPRRLYRIHLELSAVVDFTGQQLPDGFEALDLRAQDLAATQEIGEAAQYLGREAIRAPSATGVGEILAVFIDRLQPDSVVEAGSYETWTAVP